MVRNVESLLNEVTNFLRRPGMIGLEEVPQLLALPIGQFRGPPAAVGRRESADAAVVPPLRPPRAGWL
jgi:hypothetical protein